MSTLKTRLTLSTLTLTLLLSCTAPVLQPGLIQNRIEANKIKAIQTLVNEDEQALIELQKDPKAYLQKQGITLSADQQVKVMELSEKLFLVLDDRSLMAFHSNLIEQTDADKSDLQKQLDVIRSKANKDPDFKNKLLNQTAQTLESEGIDSTVATLFTVVDYTPNTNLLLIVPPDSEVNRGVSQETKDFFNELGPAFKRTVDQIIEEVKAKISGIKNPDPVLKPAAKAMVLVNKTKCKLKDTAFSCDPNKGQSESYWMIALKEYLDIPVTPSTPTSPTPTPTPSSQPSPSPSKAPVPSTYSEIEKFSTQIEQETNDTRTKINQEAQEQKKEMNPAQHKVNASLFSEIVKKIQALEDNLDLIDLAISKLERLKPNEPNYTEPEKFKLLKSKLEKYPRLLVEQQTNLRKLPDTTRRILDNIERYTKELDTLNREIFTLTRKVASSENLTPPSSSLEKEKALLAETQKKYDASLNILLNEFAKIDLEYSKLYMTPYRLEVDMTKQKYKPK